MLDPRQKQLHDDLLFDYGFAFYGPPSYEVHSPEPVRLAPGAMAAAEADLAVITGALRRLYATLPCPSFPLQAEAVATLEGGPSPFFAGRFDLAEDQGGTLRLVELNLDRNGLQRESMVTDPRFRQNYLQTLAAYWEKHGRQGAPPRTGVLIAPVYREESALAPFLVLAVQEGLGWPAQVVGAGNLVAEAGQVSAFGQRLDLIIRQFPTEYLHELEAGSGLLDACRRGTVLVVNSPAAIVGQAKSWMAEFWLQALRPDSSLTADERAAVRRLIPYTATLEAARLPRDPADPGGPMLETREALTRFPERWVLKPALGRYSWGVTCGALIPADAWQTALHVAISQPQYWIAQAYVPQRTRSLRRWRSGRLTETEGYVSYGVHMLDGQLAGWAARCSQGPVTDDAWFASVQATAEAR